jgi:hypothetical protein
MAARVFATIGRAPGNDVTLDHPTVSNHHARLSWSGGSLLVEDLSSANGTYLDGERIKTGRTRPGADVRIGELELPWSHEGLRVLLKAGAGARTLVMPTQRTPMFVCGACGTIGSLPPGPVAKRLTCPKCNATLKTGTKPTTSRGGMAWAMPAMVFAMLLGGAVFYVQSGATTRSSPLAPAADLVRAVIEEKAVEQHIGGETAKKLAAALTPMDPITRNAAVKLAARKEGPFHVEQVAEIWSAVRGSWRYVNDPEGREYFATASETIQNGYVGDCDDFAITLASMVTAVGGKARVILMDGPDGGHAYTEACVQGEVTKVAAALVKQYKNRFRRYVVGAHPTAIAYRTSADCPIWLNLDWNSNVPGGAYVPEQWAVAIYEGGRSESLAPASPVPAAATTKSATVGTGTSTQR